MVQILEKKRRIAENIKQERIFWKISRRELALWTGVTYSSLRHFEETGDISFEGFIRIGEFLGWETFIYIMENKRPKFRRSLRYMRAHYPNKKFYED